MRALLLAAQLLGTVTDAESGAPIEGATVIVESERGVEVAKAVSDAGGRFVCDRLHAGTFRVRATARGYQRRYFGGDWVEGKPVTVGGPEPTTADIALPRAAEIAGTVWRPDGTPLHPGYVWLIWRGGEELRYFSTPTREDGSYASDDLPPGPYSARALTYDPVARQLVSPDWDFPFDLTLTVGVPARIDVHLQGETPEPNWVALVTDEKGQPLPGVQLMILRVIQGDGKEETQHVSVRRTGAQGRCQLDELPPGRYRVTTFDVPPPYAPWRNPDPAARGADEYARHFEIEPGRRARTEMQLFPGHTLRVVLQDAAGQPAPDDAAVAMEIWSRGPEPFGGERFTARPERVGPGELQVRGLMPGASYELRLADRDDRARWCLAGAREPRERTLAVPAASDPPPLEIRVKRCPSR